MRSHAFWSAVACLSLLGCEPSVGPRELEWPVFDAKQPFLELASGTRAPRPEDDFQEALGADSDFERAIAREAGAPDEPARGPGEAAPAVAASSSIQAVPLAGTFVGDVPVVFDEWQWSTDGGVTIITHRKPGSAPDALIYVEGFSPAVDDFPSYEVGRFQYTVDPRLSTNVVYPPLIMVGVKALKGRTGFPPVDVAFALQKATTRTSGVGVGYSSTRGSFTGWRWVGKNRHGLDMRLGRTTGTWGSAFAMGDPTSLQLLNVLARTVPELREVADNMGSVMRGAQTARGGMPPAWMVLGSVQKKESMGVHVAIICERQPVCPVAEELSRFLGSIRLVEGSIQTGPGGQADLLAFAAEAGFRILSADQVIPAPQMVAILERAINRERGERGGQPSIPGLPQGLPIPGLPGGQPGEGNPGGLPVPIPGLPPGTPNPTDVLRNLGL